MRLVDLLLLLAGAKAVGAVAGFLLGPGIAAPFADAFPRALQVADVFFLGAGGALLLVGGRRDHRAVYLGGFFLLLATSFTNRLLLDLAAALPAANAIVQALRGLETDAFTPYLLWLFVGAFPSAAVRARRRPFIRLGVSISAVLGAVLFAANLLATFAGPRPAGLPLDILLRNHPRSLYYTLVLAVTLAALPFLYRRAGRAERIERRRRRLFTAALLVGAGPVLLSGFVMATWPEAYRALLDRFPAVAGARLFVLHAFFLSLPFTTAYAVLVHRVLNVRLIARRALQYLLARGSVLVAASLPVVGLAAFVVEHRREPVVELFSGTRPLLLAAAALLALAALRYRRRLLDAIDRRFFREQYDSRRLLTDLVHRLRESAGGEELAALLCQGIDQALHLERISLLLADAGAGLLVDPRSVIRSLDASSGLVRLAAAAREPLVVDLADQRSPARRLGETDRHWLVDAGARLLVPVLASDGAVLGLIVLGEKRSGLPFLREDRELLGAIATSAALALELHRFRSMPGPAAQSTPAADRPLPGTAARECPRCGRIHLPESRRCGDCDRPLVPARVPYVLPGRFRFERRIGEGGMGVVYRAADLALGRPVAVKTLRRVSPEHALRLRREAQTAAAVTHPHLALVYGLETWRGTPFLIMEFLDGGTLADRIRDHLLEPGEVVDLGIVMARALERLHADDILHRDVKPSNIGYADGGPKLMDFGIARLRFDPRQEGDARAPSGELRLPPTSIWHSPEPATSGGQLVGTLAYLAPELLEGEPASPASDLWSLALVLQECLCGRQTFDGDGTQEILASIRRRPAGKVREARPDCPEPLVEFLERALDRDPRRRPPTARAFADALGAL